MEVQQAADTLPHGDPFALFDTWYREARGTELNDSKADWVLADLAHPAELIRAWGMEN